MCVIKKKTRLQNSAKSIKYYPLPSPLISPTLAIPILIPPLISFLYVRPLPPKVR